MSEKHNPRRLPWSVDKSLLTSVRDCTGRVVVADINFSDATFLTAAANELHRNIARIELLRTECLAAIGRMEKTRDWLIDLMHSDHLFSEEELENGENALEEYTAVITQLRKAVEESNER